MPSAALKDLLQCIEEAEAATVDIRLFVSSLQFRNRPRQLKGSPEHPLIIGGTMREAEKPCPRIQQNRSPSQRHQTSTPAYPPTLSQTKPYTHPPTLDYFVFQLILIDFQTRSLIVVVEKLTLMLSDLHNSMFLNIPNVSKDLTKRIPFFTCFIYFRRFVRASYMLKISWSFIAARNF